MRGLNLFGSFFKQEPFLLKLILDFVL